MKRRSLVLEAFAEDIVISNISDNFYTKEIYNEPTMNTQLTYLPKEDVYVVMPNEEADSQLMKLLPLRPSIHVIDKLTDAPMNVDDNHMLFYGDAYTYDEGDDMAIVTMLSDPKWVLFVQSGTRAPLNINDIKGKRIGVLSANEAKVGQSILETFDIKSHMNTFITYSRIDALYNDAFNTTNLDIAILYTGINSKTIQSLKAYKFAPINYDMVDMSKLHIWMPYAKKELVEIRGDSRNPQKANGLSKSITTIAICIDTMLYGNKDMNNSAIKDIVDHMNQPSKNSYYSQFFKFNKQTVAVMRDYANDILAQKAIEAYENAKEDRVLITMDSNMKGFYRYDSGGDYFELKFGPLEKVKGVTLHQGDRVRLMNQDHKPENGYYYVSRRDDAMTLLTTAMIIKGIYPKVNGNTVIVPNSTMQSYGLVDGDDVWLIDMKARGKLQYDVLRSQMVCVLQARPENGNDGDYVCVGDANLITKEACESSVDVYNKPKQAGIWDRPCKRDDECPYFGANKNYLNYRGGCTDGSCEMPMGVKRAGFTKADTTTAPYCYGCNSTVAPGDCCDKQKKDALHPDYAFEGDMDERWKAGN